MTESNHIRGLLYFLCVLSSNTLANRPKGVSVELASFYNPDMDFKCLDGSNIIGFIQINDDYCDCEDGSDEPGTSACPNGKFYCENVGHKSLLIPSSRVGDNICDCCDGSDEWESKASCQNTCEEMGRAAREAFEAASRVALEGFRIRQSMTNEAKIVLDEKMMQVQDQEKKILELEALKSEKQQLKDDAEAPEKEALDYYKKIEEEEKKRKEEMEASISAKQASDYFSILDTDADGVVTIAELRARPGLDSNKDGEVSEDEAKVFLSDNDSFDLQTFVDTKFTIMKPFMDLEFAAVPLDSNEEESANKVEDYHAPDHPMMTPAPDDLKSEDSNPDEIDDDYDISDDDSDEVKYLANNEADKDKTKYDDKTRVLINNADAARRAFDDVDKQYKDIAREIKELKESLEKDYGEDNVFAALIGQCFSYTDNEYTYKLCPFDHCSQGGTRLGNWGSWAGPKSDEYSIMKFSGGQGCWNGPDRSTIVYLQCGAENILNSVSEPNRCEYEMHFSTPAACKLPSGHDEL